MMNIEFLQQMVVVFLVSFGIQELFHLFLSLDVIQQQLLKHLILNYFLLFLFYLARRVGARFPSLGFLSAKVMHKRPLFI